jgi:hypothetical protein
MSEEEILPPWLINEIRDRETEGIRIPAYRDDALEEYPKDKTDTSDKPCRGVVIIPL